MKKTVMRVLACSLAVMVALSALAPAKTARAESSIPTAQTGVESGVLSVLATSEEKTLYLTADMADKGQIIISGGTYDRIVVPKEIDADRITFDEVEVGELIVESGSRVSVLLRATTAAKVTVEEPKLKEIDWTELRHLLADVQTIQKVIEDYTRLQEENEKYRNSAPRITAAKGTVIDSLSAGANVSLDLKYGEVSSLSVKTGVKLTRTEIAVEGYYGDIAYTGSDSFGIVSLKLKNSEVGRMTVAESCGSNYLLVSGSNSFADNIEVAGNANVSLNIPADALTVTADAEDARVDVLNKVDNMTVAADNVKVEIAPIGSVASAEVSGNKVSIGGSGTLGKANITGKGASVSTNGTDIRGENTYIPPVYTAPSVTVTPNPTPETTPSVTPEIAPSVTPETTPSIAPTTGSALVTPTGNIVEVSRAEVGDTVRFGSYEQDNDFDNGAEAIEWFVLDKQDGKLLLFSKNALDVKPYNEKREAVTWETCTLRGWLNGEFYHTAFSGTEQGRILTAKVRNEDNPKYGTGGGNDTEDKVFLLSLEEVLRYFDPDPGAKDPVRCAKVTEYVKAQGGYYEKNGEHAGNGWWWLRSPGYDSTNAAFVINTGSVDVWGDYVDFDDVVRPAFWLNLESETPTPTPTPVVTPTPTPELEDHAMDWKDVALEAAMREVTGIIGREIMLSDVWELQYLYLVEKGISNISALSELRNLTSLSLDHNSISDISALSELRNLTSLSLGYNSISDISALKGLTGLTYLFLNSNSISDISALSGLTGLTGLWLSYNSISDISALSELRNLTSLSLSYNSISDISALKGLTGLMGLDLYDNSIGDISALSELRNLMSLSLGVNSISDISALKGLTGLMGLNLCDNSIGDISALSELRNLTSLNLDGNSISDISALKGLTGLTDLSLHHNSISDISALSGLTGLTNLFLYHNSIDDISALSELRNLTCLHLHHNSISDISALSGLTGLTNLSLDYNSISDISALKGLTGLTDLSLDYNSISDISALSGLTGLTHLLLNSNSISDISALSGLMGLTWLDLNSNSISDISVLSGLLNLTKVLLWGNPITDYSPVDHVENVVRE